MLPISDADFLIENDEVKEIEFNYFKKISLS